MGRLVSAGSIAYDQIDLYDPPGSLTRAPGVTVSAIVSRLFVNNAETAWPIADGSTVPDSSVSAGRVLFNETALNSTFYSIRFFPDRVGFWRLVLRIVSLGTEIVRDYDVVPAGSFSSSGPSGGLNADFVKQ